MTIHSSSSDYKQQAVARFQPYSCVDVLPAITTALRVGAFIQTVPLFGLDSKKDIYATLHNDGSLICQDWTLWVDDARNEIAASASEAEPHSTSQVFGQFSSTSTHDKQLATQRLVKTARDLEAFGAWCLGLSKTPYGSKLSTQDAVRIGRSLVIMQRVFSKSAADGRLLSMGSYASLSSQTISEGRGWWRLHFSEWNEGSVIAFGPHWAENEEALAELTAQDPLSSATHSLTPICIGVPHAQ